MKPGKLAPERRNWKKRKTRKDSFCEISLLFCIFPSWSSMLKVSCFPLTLSRSLSFLVVHCALDTCLGFHLTLSLVPMNQKLLTTILFLKKSPKVCNGVSPTFPRVPCYHPAVYHPEEETCSETTTENSSCRHPFFLVKFC